VFVPINTEVTFVKASKNEIDVIIPDDTDLKIVNVEKFSGENINGIFHRTFGKTAVDLSQFSTKEKTNIEAGDVEPGMSKDAVIAALGYPPKHRTPTLKSNQWRYWRNLSTTFVVHFEDDKVTGIQEGKGQHSK
jgi:predicted nucleotidyltransferase component of viral defense system